MTGLNPKHDRVIEVCIERVRGDHLESRVHSLVRPESLAHDAAVGNVHVHGIDAAALSAAPTFADLSETIARALGEAVVIAHGASWDVAFLEAEMARSGHPFTIAHYIDTLTLARRALGLKRHSLEALREHFGLDGARAHRADADVATLRAVWARCVHALEPATARDVWDIRVAEGKARERILAECTEHVASGKPVTVVYRPRGKAEQPIAMVLSQVVRGLDPPRVIGYQLPGRGRRELRADRILRIEP